MFQISADVEFKLNNLKPKERAAAAISALRLLKSGRDDFSTAEKEAIALMPGFGTLRQVLQSGLDGEESGYKASIDAQLQELLTKQEYREARKASLNTFHTSPEVARAIWSVVEQLGFKGGRILEPGAGSGIFLGTTPKAIARNSEFTVIEQDPTSCEVLKALYPEAQLFPMPFQKAKLLKGSFDLAIGNVPFGSEAIASTDDLAALHLNTHNYFLAKSVQLVRPGGLIAIITSTYTLDAPSSQPFREWLGGGLQEVKVQAYDGSTLTKTEFCNDGAQVRLVGAIRLPSSAFKDNARTEVTTDILIFRKIEHKDEANPGDWVETNLIRLPGADEPYNLNRYFWHEAREALSNRRPATPRLLGTPCKNKLYGDGFALEPHSSFEFLGTAIANAASQWAPCYTKGDGSSLQIQTPPELQELPNYSYCEYDDRIWRKSLDGEAIEEVHEHKERISDFFVVRRLFDALLEAQNTQPKDEAVEPFRKALRNKFNAFRKKWGSPNSVTNRRVFNGDPLFIPIRALETKDKEGNWVDAAILSKRNSYPILEPNKAKNPFDALQKSLGFKGYMDLEWMAELLSAPVEQVTAFLNQEGAVFFDPELDRWIEKDEYLSGNVRKKLKLAREHNLQRNIDALIPALPLPCVPPAPASVETKIEVAIACDWDYQNKTPDEQQRLIENEIQAELGAVWIPDDVVQEFVNQLLNAKNISVQYQPSPISKWAIADGWREGDRVAIRKQYGTDDYTPVEIILRTMNANDLRVYRVDSDGKRHLDTEGTEAARGKQEEICQRFAEWLWNDPERAKRVAVHYNQECNNLAYRRWEADYLVFPGANKELLEKYPNRPLQNRAIAQIIASPVTHLPLPVGYGKSRCLIMGAMRLRQLGICKKAILVGLKSTISQLESSFRELYPTANILVPEANSFNRENRQLFTSAIATGDWDCIIMSHQQFEKLMMSAEYVQQYYQDVLDEVEDFITELKSNGGENRVLIKNLIAVQKRTQARLEKAIESTSKDQHISFEALGIDAVLIDEFHLYKNLHYTTSRTGVAGLPNSNSNRSQDTYMKLMWLINQPTLNLGGQGKRVVTATGTPISNSLAEMFTVMRYHIPLLMRELDIDSFDAFSSLYIKFEAAAELTARGTYKVKERARRFTNVPEMMRIFRSFSSLLTGKDKEIAEASLGKPDPVFLTIASQSTPAQLKVVDGLVQRAAAIENKLVKPDEDNMLRITGEGRKNSLDSRLLGYEHNEPHTKVNQCALNIWRLWKATREIKATQTVFCDMSTPKSEGFDVYNYVRNTLIALGIPRDQVAFIHEADTDAKREALFKKCNAGEVAVVFGSTEKLGTGVNIQERLIAMHHLDAPWRPSDIEQREGRGVRQGNTMPKVLIFRYVTSGRNGSAGFDAFMWQTLEYKADPVNQVMSGDETIRVIDDASGDALNFAAVKAIASGDERIKELADLQNEEKRLRLQLSSHERDQASVVLQRKIAIARIDELSGDEGTIAKLQADLATVQANAGKITVKDQELEEVPAEGIAKMLEVMEQKKIAKPKTVGMFHGLKLTAIRSYIGFRLTLRGQTTTVIDLEKKSHRTPKWIKSSLDAKSVAAEIQGAIDACTRSLEDCRRNLIEFGDVIGKPFPKRDRLDFVTTRVRELQDVFMKEEQARMSAKQEEAEKEAELEDDEDFWCQSVSTISPIPDDRLITELKKQPYEPVIVNDGETEREVDWMAIVNEMVGNAGAIDVESVEVHDNVIAFPVRKAMWGAEVESEKEGAIG